MIGVFEEEGVGGEADAVTAAKAFLQEMKFRNLGDLWRENRQYVMLLSLFSSFQSYT